MDNLFDKDDEVYELEDDVPTFDADVDILQLLHDATDFGLDDEGDEIPGYIFAKDISDMLELSEKDLAKFALENGYEILSAKVVGEEIPTEMLIICAKGCAQDTIKEDYKNIFDLDLELSKIESFDDSEEDSEKEVKKPLFKEDFFSDNTISMLKNKIEQPEKLRDVIKTKSDDDLYKCLGWLTLNVTSITAEIPNELKDIFVKRFGDLPETDIKFSDIATKTNGYNLSSLEKSTVLKIISAYKIPKELKTFVNEETNEIRSFSLAKVLIKVYGLRWGENEPEENIEKISVRLSDKSTALKAFESGYSLVNIERNEKDLDNIIADADKIVKQDAEDWLAKHIKNIYVEVPDFMLKKFNHLFPDAVLGKHYKVVDNRTRTPGGYLKKWGIGASLSVDTTEGAPGWLQPYFKDKRIDGHTGLVLSLLYKYGFDFGKESNLKEDLDIYSLQPGTKIKLNKDTLYADSELEGMFEDDADLLDEFLGAGFILKGTELFIPAGSVLTFVMSQSVDVYDLNGLQFEVAEWPDNIDFTVLNEGVAKNFKDEKKELNYLWEKEKVADLDKWERHRLQSLIQKYGRPDDDLEESNELETRAKKHKKTDRKGARGWFVNPNAGNVEHNVDFFNKAMGNKTAQADGSIGAVSVAGDSGAVSGGMGESIDDEDRALVETSPRGDETKEEFVARFMSEMEKEYPNPKQRYAVALSYWEHD